MFVPALRTNARGTTWANGTPAGTSLPISTFYVVKSGDTAATINAALAAGKNLLVTPGVYHLNQTLERDPGRHRRPRPRPGHLRAGQRRRPPCTSPTSTASRSPACSSTPAPPTRTSCCRSARPARRATHAANPTVLSDVFFRIGGADRRQGHRQRCEINSNNVIGDHAWIWRADHGNGGTVGWTINTARNGLVVNGNNVTFYGLFVEHYQQYQTIWNGNGGRTYFYQNEMPYDPPNQAAYMNGVDPGLGGVQGRPTRSPRTRRGAWAATATSTSTRRWSTRTPSRCRSSPGVKFHDMVTVSLGGTGTISHVINNTGAAVNSGHQVTSIVSGP